MGSRLCRVPLSHMVGTKEDADTASPSHHSPDLSLIFPSFQMEGKMRIVLALAGGKGREMMGAMEGQVKA